MNLRQFIPSEWRGELEEAISAPGFAALGDFLEVEYEENTVFPMRKEMFNGLKLTPSDKVKVVILGQDPYHDDGQAHGLAFSVRPGVKYPPSLRNIFKELQDDLGCVPPETGCLEDWAAQGVLLLNTVLTVRAHRPGSHRGQGWEEFTDEVIRAVSRREKPAIFVLWGAPAHKKAALIDQSRHVILQAAHPSPLSAYRGFFGSRPFSRINQELVARGEEPIYWTREAADVMGQGEFTF
jgi:uracil-DNA glycosylase